MDLVFSPYIYIFLKTKVGDTDKRQNCPPALPPLFFTVFHSWLSNNLCLHAQQLSSLCLGLHNHYHGGLGSKPLSLLLH
ncbi:hypothetical protein HanPI659440_Chr16g0621131 [Helianthus annuus]|nr:hypothetical protein HanPI659440_Chr16g0621131 [Helianthus annuus]